MNKQKIVELRKEGYSHYEIARQVGLSRGYVWRVCIGVKMSVEGMTRYRKLKGLTKQIEIQPGLSEAKVRIIGNVLFDGALFVCKSHYTVLYVNTCKSLIDTFSEDMEKVYGVKPFIEIVNNKLKCYKLRVFSKQVYQDLLKYVSSYSTASKNCSLSGEIINMDESLIRVFLETFWSNEGSISNVGRLTADLKSKKIIYQLSAFHDKLGIKHKICTYRLERYGVMYKLYLMVSKENYLAFYNYKLFGKSAVTYGQNQGKLKEKVLKEYMIKCHFL